MSKRKKVLPTFSELKADLKPMTFKEKVDHLWTYYKGYVLGALVVAILITMVVTAYTNASKKIRVSGMLANVAMTQEGYDYLTKDYHKKLGLVKTWEVVELQSADFSSLADPTSGEDNYYASQKLILQVASGDMDYAIIDKLALDFYVHQDVFSDLRDVFPEEMMAEFAEKDMLFYMLSVPDDTDLDSLEIDPETADRIPVAIKMKGLPFAEESMHGGEYYFCATSHEPDAKVIIAVWEYILDWENR